jgi:very-short-patch-repair endonuclease
VGVNKAKWGSMKIGITSRKKVLLSRELRQNMTDAEIKLWSRLRAHQMNDIHFRRQHAIGPYVVDFCAPRGKLIIEVDGGQHLDQMEYDGDRTAYLESLGFRVIRFWNHEVLTDIDAVVLAIDQELHK